MGFCKRQSCPLANSRYAIVREKEGMLYLYLKRIERAHTPAKMREKIQFLQDYSTLGDEEEVEDEADEAGQLSSATEKSKEDPVKAITVKLDDLSGNTFVEFLGSISHPSGRSRLMRSKSCFGVASSGGILNGTGGSDFDISKSGMCGLTIPEIDLALQAGMLGGRFTTVEGIPEQVHGELSEKVGDARLEEITNAEKPFTLLLDDPFAHSYLQNLYVPDPDPNMEIVTYERKWQQNEQPGLNDIEGENHIAKDHIVVKRFEEVTFNHTNDFNQHSNREEYCASDFNTRTSRCMAAGHGTGTIILCTLKLALI
ncbi:hypothetical protein PISMIDRAFT_19474 [Pisolithus microcarpus 441]|uniref:Zinc finger ZPR1-type domain-containing protein n=1 Tax=Pisolithus microcarpus 441 TaxID=765257 RepID=A0A0C9YUK7_9AGAM|nr:hypothetical protein PISMIDRAFT_19474 [Pisolithus microcarpus 441]